VSEGGLRDPSTRAGRPAKGGYSHEFDLKDINMENGYLVIDFIHESPISPLSIGESADSRMLAVLFDEIKFS